MAKMTIIEGNSNDKDNVRAYMVKGEKGYSAYDLYVQHGGTLTEEQWLDAFLNAENYYNKTETDNLLDAKANSSDVYTKSEVYTKLETDELIEDTYSTSEVKTNKVWIDGKPIYRKVMFIDQMPLYVEEDPASPHFLYSKTYSTGITNMEKLINMEGCYYSTSTAHPSASFGLNMVLPQDFYADVQLYNDPSGYATVTSMSQFTHTRLSQNGETLTINCSEFLTSNNSIDRGYKGNIILEYTKTTD